MGGVVTDELDRVVGRVSVHRRFWYTRWGELSADVGVTGVAVRSVEVDEEREVK